MTSRIIKTAIITILLLLVVVFSAGGGHGTFLPAKIVYPYTMLTTVFTREIGIFGLLIAIIQIPLYSYLWTKKPNIKYIITAVHIITVICAIAFVKQF